MARRLPHGFTLIELTVALAIAAVLFSAVTVSLGALTGTKAKAAAGELGGVIRSLYDTATLSGQTCRLVFELPDERAEEKVTRYRAECGQGGLTTSRDREAQLREENQRRPEPGGGAKVDDRFRSLGAGNSEPTLQDLVAGEKDRVESAARFSEFTSPEISARVIPSSVKISVWTRHQQKATTQGTAYLYFFPQGFTEKAQILFEQGSNAWTLTVAPLTGKTSVVAEALEVPRS